jgi:hypothetical protein
MASVEVAAVAAAGTKTQSSDATVSPTKADANRDDPIKDFVVERTSNARQLHFLNHDEDGVRFRAALACALVYVLGNCGFSPLWLPVVVYVIVHGRLRRAERAERLFKTNVIRVLHNPRHLQTVLTPTDGKQTNSAALPAWLSFEQNEPTMWLSNILGTLWPFMRRATEDSIRVGAEPTFEWLKPSFLTFLGLSRVSMGGDPINVRGVQTHTIDNHIHIDIDFQTSKEIRIYIEAIAAKVAATVKVKRLFIQVSAFQIGFSLLL